LFKLREDLYQRREKADRLKLAFASAATGGIGLGMSCACLGIMHGTIIYAMGLLSVLSVTPEVYDEPYDLAKRESRLFPEGKRLAERSAKKAGLPAPDVYISNRIQTYGAQTDGKVIEMGLDYDLETASPETAHLIGHELGHISQKDNLRTALKLAFMFASLPSIIFSIVEHVHQTPTSPLGLWSSALAMGVGCQQALYFWASRIQEYRADRFELKHTDHPLGLAEWLQANELDLSSAVMEDESGALTIWQPTWKSLRVPSLWSRLLGSHPSVPHRIRALVQLCKRVPDEVPSHPAVS
jgi:hypothetical protein